MFKKSLLNTGKKLSVEKSKKFDRTIILLRKITSYVCYQIMNKLSKWLVDKLGEKIQKNKWLETQCYKKRMTDCAENSSQIKRSHRAENSSQIKTIIMQKNKPLNYEAATNHRTQRIDEDHQKIQY
jgi:hypothetical protein